MNKALKIGIALAVAALTPIAPELFNWLTVNLPGPEIVDKAENRDNLKQGWDDDWGLNGTHWFHHTNQGTRVLPYGWFMALERPEVSLLPLARSRFVDGDYLLRFGFLPSVKDPDRPDEKDLPPEKKRPKMNPDGLPIGFAKQDDFLDPKDPKKGKYSVVGLTCAACHTGEIHYKAGDVVRAARIEGGPAMINLALFQKAIGLALAYTDRFEPRFNRFAEQVLGESKKKDKEARDKLRAELKFFITKAMEQRALEEKKGVSKLDLGFARTDALGLIGNRVFGPLDSENLSVADAPVNFPHLWDTPWFDWVQYNASIRMPMVRNIGEALGVGAVINLDVPKGQFPSSTVNVEHLHLLENQIGGSKPFQGLRSPKWEETRLKPIDPEKRERGKDLYRRFCQSCHLPPMDELEKDLASEKPRYWYVDTERDGKKTWVLGLVFSDLQLIGTDQNQALNFYRRLAYVGGKTVSAAKGLYNVTGFVRKKYYDEHFKGDPNKVFEYDRFRKFEDKVIDEGEFDLEDEGTIANSIVARLAYKARPLNGIWATAPFLHNGSVPNLYEMLVPVEKRSKTFYLGTKMFDPDKVGFVTGKLPGGFELDTSLLGNHNTGHEFRNLTLGELETALGITPPPPLETTVDNRWAKVFRLALTDWQALSKGQQERKVWEKTWELIQKRGFVVKGVIGTELSETERWDLVEYLKSL